MSALDEAAPVLDASIPLRAHYQFTDAAVAIALTLLFLRSSTPRRVGTFVGDVLADHWQTVFSFACRLS